MHLNMFSLNSFIVLAFLSVPTFARYGLQRRLVCTQDDLYTMFHNAPPDDIDPWCSSYIGLGDVQSTSNAYTMRTYASPPVKASFKVDMAIALL